jgi:hypothetical protein
LFIVPVQLSTRDRISTSATILLDKIVKSPSSTRSVAETFIEIPKFTRERQERRVTSLSLSLLYLPVQPSPVDRLIYELITIDSLIDVNLAANILVQESGSKLSADYSLHLEQIKT